jgi:hypothetical protein
VTVAIQERFERPPEFSRQVFFSDAAEQRHGRLVGLELSEAVGTLREMLFEAGVHVGRKLALEKVDQQPHDVFTVSGSFPHASGSHVAALGEAGG